MPSTSALELDPDRLLPADAAVRRIARALYDTVAGLPIISPHGHVPASWLAKDTPFTDPTSLLVTPDHYVNRLLHAHGVSLAELGVGQGPLTEGESRTAFRRLCGQIAADGSTKLVVRILPTLLAERAAGRTPVGAATTVAAWVLHLRGLGAAVKDAGAGPAQARATGSEDLGRAVAGVLDILRPGLGADADLVETVRVQTDALQTLASLPK